MRWARPPPAGCQMPYGGSGLRSVSIDPAELPHRKHCSSARYAVRPVPCSDPLDSAYPVTGATSVTQVVAHRVPSFNLALFEGKSQVGGGHLARATYPAHRVWAVLAIPLAALRRLTEIGRQVAPTQYGLDIISE